MAKRNILIRTTRKKADALFADNKILEAKALYAKICETDRLDTEAWVRLGIINRRLGLFDDAEACGLQALATQPNNATAHLVLGAALQCQGHLDSAIDCYNRAVQIRPDYADAYYYLGNALRECGRTDDAVSNYQKAVQLRPDFLEAFSNLGAALLNMAKHQEALRVLEAAYRIRPDSEQVLCNLGDLYLLTGNEEQALQYAVKAIQANPDFSDARYLLGKVHRMMGKYSEAMESYQAALKLTPSDPNIIGAIAEILEIRGQFAESSALLLPFIESGSLNARILTTFATLSRPMNTRDKAIALMETSLREGDLDFSSAIDIHFALGKLYDDIGNYREAFAHYHTANESSHVPRAGMIQGVPPYESLCNLEGWVSKHDASSWARLPHTNQESRLPVFVVGMPRSGTTLIEQILSSHPAVCGAGELPEIGNIAHLLPSVVGGNYEYPRCLEEAGARTLEMMAERYLNRLDDFSTDAQRVIDKMPTNFQHVGLISLLFPKARVIHIVRNPADTCLSIYFQKFGATLDYTTDLQLLGRYYRSYRKLMEHWKAISDIPILEIEYENLVTETESVCRTMTEFCGLDWDPACLSFYKIKRDVNTPSYDQVRRPIYGSSIERWKHYEPYIRPLMSALND